MNLGSAIPSIHITPTSAVVCVYDVKSDLPSLSDTFLWTEKTCDELNY